MHRWLALRCRPSRWIPVRRSPMALVPAAPIDALAGKNALTAVGFEPTHPKIVELESTALDHSAKLSVSSSVDRNHLVKSRFIDCAASTRGARFGSLIACASWDDAQLEMDIARRASSSWRRPPQIAAVTWQQCSRGVRSIGALHCQPQQSRGDLPSRWCYRLILALVLVLPCDRINY